MTPKKAPDGIPLWTWAIFVLCAFAPEAVGADLVLALKNLGAPAAALGLMLITVARSNQN
jgi:hypothetical protein